MITWGNIEMEHSRDAGGEDHQLTFNDLRTSIRDWANVALRIARPCARLSPHSRVRFEEDSSRQPPWMILPALPTLANLLVVLAHRSLAMRCSGVECWLCGGDSRSTLEARPALPAPTDHIRFGPAELSNGNRGELSNIRVIF